MYHVNILCKDLDKEDVRSWLADVDKIVIEDIKIETELYIVPNEVQKMLWLLQPDVRVIKEANQLVIEKVQKIEVGSI